MFGQISRGIPLTKKSWRILRENRYLMLFTIWGMLASIAAAILYFVPSAMLLHDGSKPAAYAIALIGLYCTTFIGIYFNVALAACADRAMRGQKTSFAEGIQIANERTGAIAGWAAVAVAVSQLIKQLRSLPVVGKWVAAGLSLMWGLITFLVIPVIALENVGPIEAVKRSASLFKQRWGAQLAGNVIIGVVAFLAAFAALVIAVIGAMMVSAGGTGIALGVLLIGAGVIGAVASFVVAGSIRQIFGVALYRFAADGQAIGGFTESELQSVVRQRKIGS